MGRTWLVIAGLGILASACDVITNEGDMRVFEGRWCECGVGPKTVEITATGVMYQGGEQYPWVWARDEVECEFSAYAGEFRRR